PAKRCTLTPFRSLASAVPSWHSAGVRPINSESASKMPRRWKTDSKIVPPGDPRDSELSERNMGGGYWYSLAVSRPKWSELAEQDCYFGCCLVPRMIFAWSRSCRGSGERFGCVRRVV